MPSLTPYRQQRFWAKVNKTDTCWLWAGYIKPEGYGLYSLGTTSRAAHRVAYELAVGPIPEGLILDHLCRVRNCVNPDHLEPVTHRENSMRSPQWLAEATKTHCLRGHEYTPDNIIPRASGTRTCRECARARNREYSRRGKAEVTQR